MPKLLTAVFCCGIAHAAVISGVVLDRSTGRPLARSLVALRPVDGTPGKPQSARANRTGQFRFSVSAGMYLLRASRNGFAPFQYGQKDWKSAGKPMAVEPEGSLYLDIRLRRYGAISGTILDENEIGIPEQKVIAYPARQPLQIAATATTDDRGIYRIHGLEPGTYYVRSAAKSLEEGDGLLPTFHKETMAVDQAVTVEVDLDQQADDINIRPLPGKLVRLSGEVIAHPSVPVTVTLISDVGRMEVKTVGPFSFEQLAPGAYELIADAADPLARGKLGSYREIPLDADMQIQVPLNVWRETEFRMQDEKGNPVDVGTARIVARRKNLDGGGRAEVLKLVNGRVPLGPGRWEMSVTPSAAYYPTSVSGSFGVPDSHARADGWSEVLLRDMSAVTIRLSSRPATVHGSVTGPGQEPVPGAPVYLEAFDPQSRQRLTDLRSTRTDLRGRYRFAGLTPGPYRILSTFEYEKPDEDAMAAGAARLINLSEATDTTQDLDLYAP